MKSFYNKQKFQPNFLSIFINPFYILRISLFLSIKRYAPNLKGRLLDFGCGSKPYRNLFSVEEYVGVDMINEGHPHESEQIDFYYDGRKIPFGDNHFDSLFCSEVFEHIFNLDEIIDELKRVLKNNALVLITVPFSWDEHEIPYDFGRYSSYGIKAVMEKNGFEIIEQQKTNHFVSVISQYWILYIHYLIRTKNKYINVILNFIFISPLTIFALVFGYIMPKNDKLFHNNIVYARLKK